MNREEKFFSKDEIGLIEIDFSAELLEGETLDQSQAAELITQGITFEAVDIGTAGNSISITLVDPAGAQAATVFSASESDITITLQHDGVSISATVDSLVSDFDSAPIEVTSLISVSGSGSDLLVAAAVENLSGGTEETTVTCQKVSVADPVDSIDKIEGLPVTVDGTGKLSVLFKDGEENATYRVDVLNNTTIGRKINKRVYVSIHA